MKRIFGMLFLATGFFAIIGGLYTWGQGNIFRQEHLMDVLIPWADIVFTGPLSILCAYGILKSRAWGNILALVTSGVYVFGSVLVWVGMVWNGLYPWYLVIPSLSGVFIGSWYIMRSLRITRLAVCSGKDMMQYKGADLKARPFVI